MLMTEGDVSDHRRQSANAGDASEASLPAGSNPVPFARFIQVLAMIVALAALSAALATTPPLVGPLAFSNDGKTLIGVVNGSDPFTLSEMLSGYGAIKVWDATTGDVLTTLSGPGVWLRSIAISSDGSTLAVAGDSPSIELWDLRLGKRTGVLNGHTQQVREVKFASSGSLLASASYTGEVRLWNLARKTIRPVVQVDRSPAYELGFAPDGQTLAVCDSTGVSFLSTKDGRVVKEFRGEKSANLGLLGFTKNGEDFLLARYEPRHGHRKTVLDGATQAVLFAPRLFSGSRPLLSPDGRTIAFADWSGSVSILDAASGGTLVRGDGLLADASALAFSPDGSLLAAADGHGTVCVWDAATFRRLTRFSADDPAHRWGPPVAAIMIYALAAMFVRKTKHRAAARQNLHDSGESPQMVSGQTPTIKDERLSSAPDLTPAAERMWDHWLDGSWQSERD
jgi:WD40 repeat protein